MMAAMSKGSSELLALTPAPDRSALHPAMVELLTYWEAHCPAPGEITARADLDPPLDIPHLLPDLFMVNVIDGGREFVVRLVGTRVVERYGRETTGEKLSTLTAGVYRDAIFALHRACIDLRRPIHSVTNYLHPDRTHPTAARLMLPLRGEGDAVEIVLTLQLFQLAKPVPSSGGPGPLRQVIEEIAGNRDAFRFRAHSL
jgi:hypothetical protein